MRKIYFIFSVAIISLFLSSCGSGDKADLSGSNQNVAVQYGIPFDNVPDRRDVTMYQVNIRAFSEEGNFSGVTNRLDSISDLGANVVYLMPIYPVGEVKSVNSPYCVKNYTEVNTEFGTLEDLRTLVDKAHSNNMAVILDWVANHTSYDNVWIQHKSWYLQDSTGNVISPPGMGWNDVAQLNFSNQDMRNEMIKSMKYWILTANVDGFRCDYADGPPYDFWKQALDTLRSIPNRKLLMMAEGRRSDHYKAGFDFNFGFQFFGNLKRIFEREGSVKSIEKLNISDYEGATDGQQIIRYTSNHDVNSSDGTPLDLFGGEKGSMAAFVIAAYMKSVPMIYNGQEVGTPYRLTFPFTSTTIDWKINPQITAEYKKIIAFRNENESIRRGELSSFCSDDVCAFSKKYNEEEVLVLVNCRDKNIEYSLNPEFLNTKWKNVMSGDTMNLPETISLKPYEYIVLKK
ncbi:MAG: alpha-amylase family glycosyl hydrolase [Dysgonamonadaceae bacterium]|nr:alpha-amylase family glycosyl hydrolase [Dysgonamonadaceae bacterium]MDD3900701.1 alpha-amylase family glycosyl hydrolase [Dysgonamonadaceae bacterium]